MSKQFPFHTVVFSKEGKSPFSKDIEVINFPDFRNNLFTSKVDYLMDVTKLAKSINMVPPISFLQESATHFNGWKNINYEPRIYSHEWILFCEEGLDYPEDFHQKVTELVEALKGKRHKIEMIVLSGVKRKEALNVEASSINPRFFDSKANHQLFADYYLNNLSCYLVRKRRLAKFIGKKDRQDFLLHDLKSYCPLTRVALVKEPFFTKESEVDFDAKTNYASLVAYNFKYRGLKGLVNRYQDYFLKLSSNLPT